MATPRHGDIAERVIQALEAADTTVARVPGRVAAAVLVALGSSPAEHSELAQQVARCFRDERLRAVEAAVRCALAGLSAGPAR